MTLEEAAWVLVNNRYRGADDWLIDNRTPNVVELVGPDKSFGRLTDFEAIAIAEKLVRDREAAARDKVQAEIQKLVDAVEANPFSAVFVVTPAAR